MDYSELFLRLGAATLAGGAIGLNRDLHGKPTGVRTLSMVSIGSALVVMASNNFGVFEALDSGAISRTIQGVLTGIGFLGAGVIVRGGMRSTQIHGLTTAACIWVTACLGIVCGVAAWQALAVAMVLLFVVLLFGRPLEDAIYRRWGQPPDD